MARVRHARSRRCLAGFSQCCHHRAAALVDDGAGHCDVLCRRYHGWTYDAAGRLRQTPDFGDNPAFKKADYGLYPVRVESWRGLVFVNLDSEAGPLGESLGEPVKEAAPHPIED
ncbi:MAG: Rieske 2Fe-2S domain-containing protein [Dongiaceae bacterium]